MAPPFYNEEDAPSRRRYDDVTSEAQQERIFPLHDACSDGDEQKALELIRQGTDVNAADTDGQTPLDKALDGKHEKLAIALIQNGAEIEYNVQFLHHAINESLLDLTKFLIERGDYVSSVNSNGKTPLHMAASKGFLDVARLLVEKGADVNHASREKATPLHLATIHGHANVASVLIENGANVTAIDSFHETPLHLAASNGHDALAELLISKGCAVNYVNLENETPLHHAAAFGYGNVARLLLENGGHANAANRKGETPLHLAVSQGHTDVVQLLLENGADINASNKEGETPLQCAASYAGVDLARLLLENGADVNATDSGGATALYHAATKGNVELVNLLAKMSGDVNAPNFEGETPLLRAATYDHAELTKLLIDLGVDVNKPNPNGETALHRAAFHDHLVVVHILTVHGADVNATDKYLKTPLFNAVDEEHCDVSYELIQQGANVNMPANVDMMEGDSPLHRAAQNGDLNTALLLIKNGAIVDSVNGKGNTPLHLAAGRGRREMARYLVKHGANVNAINKEGNTPLHIVVTRNFIAMVDMLITFGANVNAPDATGKTALHLAIKSEYLEIIYHLMHRGSDVNVVDDNLATPLHLIACTPWLDIAQRLIYKGADISSRDNQGKTPLQRAAAKSNPSMMKLLRESVRSSRTLVTTPSTLVGNIAQSVICIALPDSRKTPEGGIVTFISRDDFKISEILQRVIDLFADQFETGRWKKAFKPTIKITKTFINNEGKIVETLSGDLRDQLEILTVKSLTPMETIMIKGKPVTSSDGDSELIKQLRDDIQDLQNEKILYKARIQELEEELSRIRAKEIVISTAENVETSDIMEDLDIIERAGVVEVLEMVHERDNAEKHPVQLQLSSAKNEDDKPIGWTVLHEAAHKGDLVCLQKLSWKDDRGSGVDKEVMTSGLKIGAVGSFVGGLMGGLTTLGAHRSTIGFPKQRDYLYASLDNDVDVIDSNQDTPLHVAAKAGHSQVVDYLISKGANINAVNLRNQTPHNLALESNHLDVELLLLEHGANLFVPEQRRHVEDSSSTVQLEISGKDIERIERQMSDMVASEQNLRKELEEVVAFYHELQNTLERQHIENVAVNSELCFVPIQTQQRVKELPSFTDSGTEETERVEVELTAPIGNKLTPSQAGSSVKNRGGTFTMLSLLSAPVLVSALLFCRFKS